MQNPDKSEGIKGRFFVQAPQDELKAHYEKLSRMKQQNEHISTVVSVEEILEDEYLTLEEALKTIDC